MIKNHEMNVFILIKSSLEDSYCSTTLSNRDLKTE
jgi:hypothetical protein